MCQNIIDNTLLSFIPELFAPFNVCLFVVLQCIYTNVIGNCQGASRIGVGIDDDSRKILEAKFLAR